VEALAVHSRRVLHEPGRIVRDLAVMLAGLPRAGCAGANTAADHVEVLGRALAQLPQGATGPGTLARRDRGCDPLRQGLRTAQPALPRLCHERGLARARARRLRPAGLDAEAAALWHGSRRLRAQALRYRVLHVAGRIARHARGLRLPRSWPWAQTFAIAFTRLRALPSG
jgi:hypothetical protein